MASSERQEDEAISSTHRILTLIVGRRGQNSTTIGQYFVASKRCFGFRYGQAERGKRLPPREPAPRKPGTLGRYRVSLE